MTLHHHTWLYTMSHAFQSLSSPQTHTGSISSYLKLINFTLLHTVLELSFLSMPNKHKDEVAKIPYLDTTKKVFQSNLNNHFIFKSVQYCNKKKCMQYILYCRLLARRGGAFNHKTMQRSPSTFSCRRHLHLYMIFFLHTLLSSNI